MVEIIKRESFLIALGMSKEIRFHKNHEDAERYVLEKGFKRSHEERIVWLLNHIRTLQKFNPIKKEMSGYILKKGNG